MTATKSVIILYKNWRGETAWREVVPKKIWYGTTEWHPEEQWFLKATDLEKKADRDFVVRDILQWSEE